LFGGTIDVESAPGEGSVFRVAFPVKPADMYSEAPVSLPVYGETGVSPYNNNEGGSKPTILVVEDNPDQILRRGRTAGAHQKPAEKPESPAAAGKPHVRFHRASGLESGLRRCPFFSQSFGKLPSEVMGRLNQCCRAYCRL
jgi:hypothetical protein